MKAISEFSSDDGKKYEFSLKKILSKSVFESRGGNDKYELSVTKCSEPDSVMVVPADTYPIAIGMQFRITDEELWEIKRVVDSVLSS